ncbi:MULTISPECIES: flagella synthesis protein FlgN [unclassified Massilia]|uniref:flagella synthesis protein FlgN n=1 Tax=unclassified Massilia TaxID=2609279 RepID=UPI00177FFA57|nr:MULTISPECIES: flagellar protein FlgN [unclassified Massilia]MBD8528804.1 flagellar protein FlgN [Massilia sp. CFBP 13647]MBD8673445.1 flagellar protein FlgN [Massilia sp. CFBP 13721]
MTLPHATLTSEHERIAALVDLMKQEQQLLVAADADALGELTPRKVALVQELAQLSRQRHGALGAAGFIAAEAGMEPWLAARGDDAARAAWSQLLAATAEAKELNRVNGMLLNRQMAHNQTVLNALRTPAAAPESTLYGAKGQTFGSAPSRRFVLG